MEVYLSLLHFLIIFQNKVFILKIFDKISYQFSKIADLQLLIFLKKSFLNYFLVSLIIIFSIALSGNKVLEFLGTTVSLEQIGEIYKIANTTINIKDIDDLYRTPLILRILGVFQGIVILFFTPFGIKPTIITTILFFSSFFTGLIRTFSLKKF